MNIFVYKHLLASLIISVDFQKWHYRVRVSTFFKILTLISKLLSTKMHPFACPLSCVSHSLRVWTVGCYCFYEILANLMNKSQSTIEHYNASTANYVKHFVHTFPLCEYLMVFPACLPVWVLSVWTSISRWFCSFIEVAVSHTLVLYRITVQDVERSQKLGYLALNPALTLLGYVMMGVSPSWPLWGSPSDLSTRALVTGWDPWSELGVNSPFKRGNDLNVHQRMTG